MNTQSKAKNAENKNRAFFAGRAIIGCTPTPMEVNPIAFEDFFSMIAHWGFSDRFSVCQALDVVKRVVIEHPVYDDEPAKELSKRIMLVEQLIIMFEEAFDIITKGGDHGKS